jgi:hypothetical protein
MVGWRSTWERLITRHDARPFLLADEGGQVLIDPRANFRSALQLERHGSSRWYDSADQETLGQLRALVLSAGVETDGPFGVERALRYRQSLLQLGQSAAVRGQVAEPDGGLVIRGTAEEMLLIVARPPLSSAFSPPQNSVGRTPPSSTS